MEAKSSLLCVPTKMALEVSELDIVTHVLVLAF